MEKKKGECVLQRMYSKKILPQLVWCQPECNKQHKHQFSATKIYFLSDGNCEEAFVICPIHDQLVQVTAISTRARAGGLVLYHCLKCDDTFPRIALAPPTYCVYCGATADQLELMWRED